MRGGREGVRARGPGELHGHAAVRAQGDGRRGGGDGAGCGVGDPLVRARLQGPPRLRLGVGRHCLAAALAADTAAACPTHLTWRFYCHAPEGRPVSLPVLISVAGKRWPVEECFQQGKGQAGLDQHQVRTWHSFCRHTVLSMSAQALLAVAAARPAPPGSGVPASGTAGQPATWADTGKLPASAEDQPPGDEPGLVKVSVPEARRLARLATAPYDRHRPHPRPHLVTMAPPPPGPRPMAPLPRPAHSRTGHLNPARRKET